MKRFCGLCGSKKCPAPDNAAAHSPPTGPAQPVYSSNVELQTNPRHKHKTASMPKGYSSSQSKSSSQHHGHDDRTGRSSHRTSHQGGPSYKTGGSPARSPAQAAPAFTPVASTRDLEADEIKMACANINNVLGSAGIAYCLIGGAPLGGLGSKRGTNDIDVLVGTGQGAAAARALAEQLPKRIQLEERASGTPGVMWIVDHGDTRNSRKKGFKGLHTIDIMEPAAIGLTSIGNIVQPEGLNYYVKDISEFIDLKIKAWKNVMGDRKPAKRAHDAKDIIFLMKYWRNAQRGAPLDLNKMPNCDPDFVAEWSASYPEESDRQLLEDVGIVPPTTKGKGKATMGSSSNRPASSRGQRAASPAPATYSSRQTGRGYGTQQQQQYSGGQQYFGGGGGYPSQATTAPYTAPLPTSAPYDSYSSNMPATTDPYYGAPQQYPTASAPAPTTGGAARYDLSSVSFTQTSAPAAPGYDTSGMYPTTRGGNTGSYVGGEGYDYDNNSDVNYAAPVQEDGYWGEDGYWYSY